MLQDIYKDFRLSMSERLSSPLMTSFVISWILWNYRFVLIVFSSESIDEKLFLIDKEIVFGWAYILGNGFLCPLISSGVYIFAYPYPAKWTYTFYRNRQKEILDVRRKIEDETPLTIEESKLIRMELDNKRIEMSSILELKDKEIEKLKGLLNEIPNEFKSDDKTKKELDGELSDYHFKVLNLLWNSTEVISADKVIAVILNMDLSNLEYYLKDLHEMGMVEFVGGSLYGKSGYKISQKGRKYIKKMNGELV